MSDGAHGINSDCTAAADAAAAGEGAVWGDVFNVLQREKNAWLPLQLRTAEAVLISSVFSQALTQGP